MAMDLEEDDQPVDVARGSGPKGGGDLTGRRGIEPVDDDDDFGLVPSKASMAEPSSVESGTSNGTSRTKSPGFAPEALGKKAANLSTLQKSIARNKSKPYHLWPVSLLQHACSRRRIPGHSKDRDAVKLGRILGAFDKAAERASPYVDDLLDEAAGEQPLRTMMMESILL